jgi:hypothetical protein
MPETYMISLFATIGLNMFATIAVVSPDIIIVPEKVASVDVVATLPPNH